MFVFKVKIFVSFCCYLIISSVFHREKDLDILQSDAKILLKRGLEEKRIVLIFLKYAVNLGVEKNVS